jgi:hypothetical protein
VFLVQGGDLIPALLIFYYGEYSERASGVFLFGLSLAGMFFNLTGAFVGEDFFMTVGLRFSKESRVLS